MAKEEKDMEKSLGAKILAILILLFGFSIPLPMEYMWLRLPFFLLFLAIVRGLWDLRGWARSLALFFGVLSLVLSSLYLIILAPWSVTTWEDLSLIESVMIILLIIQIPLSLTVLVYFTRPMVISAFEKEEITYTKKKLLLLEEKIERGRKRSHSGEITKAEFAELKKDCVEKERALRARIKHLNRVRLSRERNMKDKEKAKKELKEEKLEKKEEKKVKKEEKKAEKEAKKEEKEEEKGVEEEKEITKKTKKKSSPKKGEEKKKADKER